MLSAPGLIKAGIINLRFCQCVSRVILVNMNEEGEKRFNNLKSNCAGSNSFALESSRDTPC